MAVGLAMHRHDATSSGESTWHPEKRCSRTRWSMVCSIAKNARSAGIHWLINNLIMCSVLCSTAKHVLKATRSQRESTCRHETNMPPRTADEVL